MSGQDGAEIPSIQELFHPTGTCFGCGPANPVGLRLRSFPSGDDVVASVTVPAIYENGYGITSGGIVATLLDCHTGAVLVNELRGYDWSEHPPFLTYRLDVSLRRPTPIETPLRIAGRIAERRSTEIVVEAEVRDPDGRATASMLAGWRPVLRRL